MSNDGPTQIFPELSNPSPSPAVLDIIFVHGLGGDRLKTWQKSDSEFWPRWLTEQFPSCRVYMIGYDSDKFAGFLAGEGASIQDLAMTMADQIASREERAPNALLVAHSLGGLIVKQMLRRCADSVNPDFTNVGRSVAGVAFMATPHQGASASSALDFLLGRFKSKQVKQLAYSDDALIDLNEFFRSWVSRHSPSVRSFYETERTGGIYVVDKVSANPGIVGSDPIAVQANHIDICKPASQTAPVYASMCAMIRKILATVGSASGGVLREPNDDDGDRDREPTGGRLGLDADQSPASEVLADFEYYRTVAEHDRRDLGQKLTDAGRSYSVRDAKRKKERFSMMLQRHIAQPSAVSRYTQLMADVDSRFSRHVARVIANDGDPTLVDQTIQDQVIAPCTATHSVNDEEITASFVDGALFYLAGNCHLAWDNE